MSPIKVVQTQPFDDQKPGTSGLRKRVSVFQQPHYLENFIHSIFTSAPELMDGTLILGGDGRYHNAVAIQTIIKMAAAYGLTKIIIGQNGLLSTPACSCIIRKYKANGGIVLSASHNPAGPKGDFGIKYNGANGGPVIESVTDEIFAQTRSIQAYKIVDMADIDLSKLGTIQHGAMTIEIINSVTDYANLMESLFDFNAIRALFASGFALKFDAMHAITGPYAVEIFVNRLGASSDSLMNATPLTDFGGGHPDPNPVYAKALFDIMFSNAAPNFGAASDGDGDRHIVLGRDVYISPSDSLAILTANAHLAKGYQNGLSGVARSMPTSRAVDNVAHDLGIECHETPTGWKFFGSLLDAGRITLCGEESAGAGSNHIREKDGLWAILLWLNILAVSRKSMKSLLHDHWAQYGRHYYSRHDYEGVETTKAQSVMQALETQFDGLVGQSFEGEIISKAESFSYTDPIDMSVSHNQGLRVEFEGGARFVMRLSGTGTVGATLRLYLEKYEPIGGDFNQDIQMALAPIASIADQVASIHSLLNRDAPTLIS